VGRTPAEFVRRRGVEYACGRLVGTPAPLAEVAPGAGFSHQSHFCRAFESATGMTPAAYRRLFAARA
jgi:AraC-like DNA-binding protein